MPRTRRSRERGGPARPAGRSSWCTSAQPLHRRAPFGKGSAHLEAISQGAADVVVVALDRHGRGEDDVSVTGSARPEGVLHDDGRGSCEGAPQACEVLVTPKLDNPAAKRVELALNSPKVTSVVDMSSSTSVKATASSGCLSQSTEMTLASSRSKSPSSVAARSVGDGISTHRALAGRSTIQDLFRRCGG